MLVGIVALLFLVTLFGNMISWSMGVNSTAAYAAERGDMPAVFARRRKDNDMPVGSALVSGIVASAVCLLGSCHPGGKPGFLPVLELLRLESGDAAAELYAGVSGVSGLCCGKGSRMRAAPSGYRGRRLCCKCLAYVPMALIALSIYSPPSPLSTDRETLATILPITVGSVISVLLGELLIAVRRRHQPHIRRITAMAKRIVGTTPGRTGIMPGEFEEQSGVWMLWPQRPDNWRGGAKPAQQAIH